MKLDKLDPRLVSVLEDYAERGAKGIEVYRRALGVMAGSAPGGVASVVAFLRCDPSADLSALEPLGVRVNSRRGSVRTATLPLTAIDRVSEQDEVLRITPAQYLRPRLDLAAAATQLPALRLRTGLTGRGVVIGIVDTGIDVRHAAFAQRITRLWDQTKPGPGVTGAPYGTEFVAPTAAHSRDTDGHGTHVAGIAAGADAMFPGVAHEAELVIVKTNFQDAGIGDAVRYVFDQASALGLPAVVNLSLGGHSDPHDGTDDLCEIIDQESGPGRIVVCAAGNEGSDNIHGRAQVPPGAQHTMRFKVPAAIIGYASLSGWYTGASELELALRSPGGVMTPFLQPQAAGSQSSTHVLQQVKIRLTTEGIDPRNGARKLMVELTGQGLGTAVTGGVWRLVMRNIGTTPALLDVWTFDDADGSSVIFTGSSVARDMKIGSPGSAAAAVTVAACTTRDRWTDSGGIDRSAGFVLGDLADFSSNGPLRSGSPKPDVTAPGAMIASALSADAALEPETVLDLEHAVMPGTSMAAPFVAGVAALMLQRDPGMTPQDFKTALRGISSIPGQPAGSTDARWGCGLPDLDRL